MNICLTSITILNQFYLNIEISHISIIETELTKNNLEYLKHIHQSVLVIFDRGYPSIELFDFFEAKNKQDIRKKADEEVSKKSNEKSRKYPIRTNENITIGLFIDRFISGIKPVVLPVIRYRCRIMTVYSQTDSFLSLVRGSFHCFQIHICI